MVAARVKLHKIPALKTTLPTLGLRQLEYRVQLCNALSWCVKVLFAEYACLVLTLLACATVALLPVGGYVR